MKNAGKKSKQKGVGYEITSCHNPDSLLDFKGRVMRYLILVLAFITVLFTANMAMDGYFAKEKERRLVVYQQEHAPKYLSCKFCGYAEHEMYFKEGRCPRCLRKLE